MRVFANSHTPLADLPCWRSARDQLGDALRDSPREVIATWLRLLAARFRPGTLLRTAPARLQVAQGRRLRDVAAEIGVSIRKLRQDLTDALGLPPKTFGRISRLQRTVRQVAQGGELDWAEVALRHGFFDQSHLIRDFCQFTGMTPSLYCARNALDWNHIVELA